MFHDSNAFYITYSNTIFRRSIPDTWVCLTFIYSLSVATGALDHNIISVADITVKESVVSFKIHFN